MCSSTPKIRKYTAAFSSGVSTCQSCGRRLGGECAVTAARGAHSTGVFCGGGAREGAGGGVGGGGWPPAPPRAGPAPRPGKPGAGGGGGGAAPGDRGRLARPCPGG